MKNKKRKLAFWLAFSMAFSLEGCGVENSENEKSKHWEKLKAENAESSDTEGITGIQIAQSVIPHQMIMGRQILIIPGKKLPPLLMGNIQSL